MEGTFGQVAGKLPGVVHQMAANENAEAARAALAPVAERLPVVEQTPGIIGVL